MRTRILLVEDEATLRDTIKLNLELEGYVVRAASNASEAFQYFQEERFNIIILDVMMPGMSGLDLSERIRLENREIPILFLSAKGTAEDRVKGLKAGGNDYLAKPFNLEELLLRVGILIRTSLQGNEKKMEVHQFQFGSNFVNFQTMEANTSNGPIQLTKRESRLLQLLVDKKNQVVSREEILEKVWGYDVFPSTRTIDNFILSFRKYFEENPKEPQFFHSVRGVGYRFNE
jgi:two-component system alkaline phosphatase synthesis response regulator PhoP